MVNDTIKRTRAAQSHINRPKAVRQIKEVGYTGMLTICNTNRSIVTREAKTDAAKEKRLVKEYKRYGCEPPQPAQEETEASIDAARAARENSAVFFLDPTTIR